MLAGSLFCRCSNSASAALRIALSADNRDESCKTDSMTLFYTRRSLQATRLQPHATSIHMATATSSFVLTTNAGLEAFVSDELRAAAQAARLEPPISPGDVELRPWQCFGRVLLKRPYASDDAALSAGPAGAI